MPNDIEEQTLSERLAGKAVKTMEQQVGKQVEKKLKEGQNPQEILMQLMNAFGGNNNQQNVLQQLTELSQTQVPSGERMGVIPSLLSGHGLSRPERTEDLGLNNAIRVLGLQQQAQQANVNIPKTQVDLLNSLVDLSQKVQGFNLEGEQIERDISGEPTTKGIMQQKEAGVQATKSAEDKIKKQQLKNDLNMYFEVADLIPTGEGFERFKVGIENFAQSITQKTPVGVASSRLKSLNKRLRVTLVRAAGDVGNLNIVEQKAAEELLFKLEDSTQERSLKKAILQDLTKAVKEKDSSKTKILISTWLNSGFSNVGGKEENEEKKYKSQYTLDNVLEGL